MPAIAFFWEWFCYASGVLCAISLALYLLPLSYLSFLAGKQDLRKKYNASWAVVTGGSSGIGKQVVRELAMQGINVCIVALDDDLLKEAVQELHREFDDVQFRPVAVNLGKEPEVYMDAVVSATRDIPVSIVVNNAGYLAMGFFDERPVEAHIANIECNAIAAVRLTHHFYIRMVQEDRRGCITFTSSAAWFMPCPFASMYGATKAFLSHFAQSLAIEADSHNIDVTVYHPSFTHTNLYANTPKFGVINALARMGVQPSDVAKVITKGAGRVAVRDAGMYAITTNIIGRIVDAGALTKLIIPFRDSMAPPGSIKKRNHKKM